MQVYASYRYRRDLVEILKPCLTQGRVLEQQEALAQESAVGVRGERVPMDPPDMRQSIAWHLALAAVKKQEAAEAEELLRSETGCEMVREVQVRLRTRKRNARLVYIPAFTVRYVYGENFDVHGVRRPEQFQAVISGLDGSVAAERHFSPQKVQLTAAVVMGAVSSAAAAVGLQGQLLLSPASFLAALLVCTSAGLAARLSPLLLRQHEEDRRIQTEEADMEKVMSQGLGPQDMLDDKHEEIRSNAEWRRWEEANKWAWNGSKRQKWAEALWRRQQVRRLQRKEFERRRARAEARFQIEQEAEAKRQKRWGHSSHHARFSQGSQNVFAGSESGGGTKDFLGYYALLGLDGELRGSISSSDIKRAFQEAAMRWHPDRLHVDDESERSRAHERFSKVKKAYEVLRNPEKRRDYDSGVRDYG